MNEKDTLFRYCIQYVRQRIERTQDEIKTAQLSANEETKSSAGDKYETGRVMAQHVVEMNTRQLLEAKKLLETLSRISNRIPDAKIGAGSLVKTSSGSFYIAISIGKFTIDQTSYFIISPESPLGKLFMGKQAGDSIERGKESFHIQSVE